LSILRGVPIRGQMIRLGQLLKLTAVIDSDAEIKTIIETEPGVVEWSVGREVELVCRSF
jgi:ribosome-associated protein YbcJ (S4-like RNA binding protein)